MNPPFRPKQEVIIDAPLETVWEFGMDITRIPSFHLVQSEWNCSRGKLAEQGASSSKDVVQCSIAKHPHYTQNPLIRITIMRRYGTSV
jgi:hypothetical protein